MSIPIFKGKPVSITAEHPLFSSYSDALDDLNSKSLCPFDSGLPDIKMAYFNQTGEISKRQYIIGYTEGSTTYLDSNFCRRLDDQQRDTMFKLAIMSNCVTNRDHNNIDPRTFAAGVLIVLAAVIYICQKETSCANKVLLSSVVGAIAAMIAAVNIVKKRSDVNYESNHLHSRLLTGGAVSVEDMQDYFKAAETYVEQNRFEPFKGR